MQKITPCLWFDNTAEEAMNYYVSVFSSSPNPYGESKIEHILRYEEGMKTPENEKMLGKVLTGIFKLNGQQFICLDGGPFFKLNEAISFQIECEDQEEVDYFWKKLSAVPESEQCGWVKDKFGLSWQIIPKKLGELLLDPDREKVKSVTNALLGMKKIEIDKLQKAYNQK